MVRLQASREACGLMIIDSDSLTFLDNSQVYAVPVGGSGSVAPISFTDSPSQTLPDTSTTQQTTQSSTVPFTPPKLFRFTAPTAPANDVGTPSSGLTVSDFGTAPVATVAAPTTTSPTSTSGSGTTATGSNPLTSGPSSAIAVGDDSINRLIDLMASQFTATHVNGGGSGFDGLVSAPLAGSDFVGGDSAPAPTTSYRGLLILALLVAGIGYWYYRSHKKRAA
jgi:hypothetical protein